MCDTALETTAGGLTTGWWAVVWECFSSHPLTFTRRAPTLDTHRPSTFTNLRRALISNTFILAGHLAARPGSARPLRHLEREPQTFTIPRPLLTSDTHRPSTFTNLTRTNLKYFYLAGHLAARSGSARPLRLLERKGRRPTMRTLSRWLQRSSLTTWVVFRVRGLRG